MIFFTKFDLYHSVFEILFSQIIRIWKLLFRPVGTYFSCKLLCLQRETALPLIRNKFLLSISASLVGKVGFSITHGKNVAHFKIKSKVKLKLERAITFVFHFFLKMEPSGGLILIKNLTDFWSSRNVL